MAIEGVPGRTMQTSFEEIWPRLASRLDVALRRRGVGISQRDDLIQETAARLWQRWRAVDAGSDVFPLAFTIARNLATDAARENRKVELRPVVDAPFSDDPHAVASARIELSSVLRMVMCLTPRYRDLLLAEAGLGLYPGEARSVVTHMARMRARRRLRAMMERAGAAIALPFKRLRDRLSEWSSSARLQAIQCFPTCSLEVVIACVLTLVASGAVGDILDYGEIGGSMSPAAIVGDDSPADLSNGSRRGVEWAAGESNGVRPLGEDGVRAAASGLPPLQDVPHSKGEGEEGGSFGPAGYDLGGEGSATIGDQDLRWRHHHTYRSPRCVRRLGEGEISTDCSGGRPPRGYVEIEHEGSKTRVEYGH